tara:strand:- start:1823 stop:2353 length:531 start_codon:yes stop_codon:yes gene_type:complete
MKFKQFIVLSILLICQLPGQQGDVLVVENLFNLMPGRFLSIPLSESDRNPFMRERPIVVPDEVDYSTLNTRVMEYFNGSAQNENENFQCPIDVVMHPTADSIGGVGIHGEFFKIGSEVLFYNETTSYSPISDARIYIKNITEDALLLRIIPVILPDITPASDPYEFVVELPQFFAK